jgi:ketosteroid isomerase-like protein
MTAAGRIGAAALGLLLATGAAKPPSPESQLLAADRAFSQLSVEKGQPYALFATTANDGRLYGNGSAAPVYGKAQAFRRLTRRDPGTMRWKPETARVSGDGRMGWTAGTWIFTGPGATPKTTGNYLTVWVKDRRGAWKVQADMGTSDPLPKK